ncbi:MarR family winged helix-turn-helix transcriptional regulator [Staphylococcus pettenkoferi]|uniref:MarR family transcriptional regulator n=1 Tax=Staphylococcus pettenkoferi TaxID=170573 RepID=A0ABT4BQ67_9STAP|nr:MarR family transcriptional regulator [Staphylococcus pettenkoferi]MCY1564126.1 MarR family transcriptional regulator [Staphylococcus pettenkoferi]MCY1571391.1 MarR family transcriptional regulator [Staphylococcus pettenkoferi]MCY1583887.1 MarR family transcriptional regulator [Staphylococcus pettenkoferi]MCY1589474.1 MarR family transcriptional regulator [Staphylococcus pettenkoferi]MCY1593460.1 MarR family transcriptional regulator [Staphylococcus pettenkoferi]
MYKQLETIITSLNEDLDLVSQRIGSKVDLSHEQFVILRLLYTKQMMSQHTITHKLHREQSLVSRWIKKLRRLDYVKSQTSPVDMRRKDLLLTERGLELVRQINEARISLLEVRAQKLTEDEQALFATLLAKLNDSDQADDAE